MDEGVPTDVEVARVALRQHGVVSLEQLRAAGHGDGAVRWRVRCGRLHRVHRGVYAVGHRSIGWRGHMWAAVLACGGPGRAALSYWAAAAVWDLAGVPSGRVDVTVAGRGESTKSLRVHQAGLAETTTHQALPVTTPMRTLRDLAATTTQHRLERLIQRAEHLRLLDTTSLSSPDGRRGARRLRTALDAIARRPAEITRTDLEERFLEAVVDAGVERPRVNAMLCGLEVDFHWPEQRLVVETDGAETHLTRAAFEEDRRRDAVLVAAGWRVVRFTHAQVLGGDAARVLRKLV